MGNSIKTILFFELTDYSLLRFPRWISNEFQARNNNLSFVYIYLYKYKNEIVELDKLPSNSIIHFLNGNVNEMDEILIQYQDNSMLFTFALRPPEFYVINRAKHYGIASSIVQHGIFIPFMKRELTFFIDEMKKMFFYFRSVCALSKKNNISLPPLLKEIYAIYIRGAKTISKSSFLSHHILPDTAFVYSEYWKEYFMQNYGFAKDQFKLTGSPDLQNYSIIAGEEKKEGICYICQTLVEDGRLSKDVFIKFINLLASTIKETDCFYIKSHPRTDLSLYKTLTERENTFLVKDVMPNCTKYIGHYSTLLMLPLNLPGDVFLWEFQGHVIPEYFSKTTNFVGNNEAHLENYLQTKNDNTSRKELLAYYFNIPNLNPYKSICEYINE